MATETRRTVSIYLNNSPAIKKLNELEQAFNKEKKVLRGLEEGSKDWINQLSRLDEAGAALLKYRQGLNLTGLSLQQLNKEARNLRAMRDHIKPGTNELKLLNIQLEEVEKRQFKLRNQKGGAWDSIKNIAIGAGLGNIMGNLAQQGFSALMNVIPNAVQENTKLADSLADVQKFTGLTGDEVNKLSKDLKDFDTRSTRSELLSLAGEAGKLNIQGAGNIKKFVQAADQIKVALGEDLGEGAVTQLAKLNNLWGYDKVYGYADAVTKAGSAVNSLGQAGVATESYIVDATSRLGGMAAQAGISQANVMGLAASMEELAITSEVGTTTINMLWADLYKNTNFYAKVAKMSVKDFSALLKKDANEAFLRVTKGMNGANGSLEHLVKLLKESGIDGSRATSVIAALAQNTDLVREKQKLANVEFEKGTSIANEFNTKNNNLAGSWDKVTKAMSSWWTNSSIKSGVDFMVNSLEKMIVVKKKGTEQLADEMIALGEYRFKLNSANLSQAERIKLINELKAQYPQYLSDIDAEKASLDSVSAALDKVNSALLKKFLIQQKVEEIAPDQMKAAEAFKKLNEEQAKLTTLLASFNSGKEAVLRAVADDPRGRGGYNYMLDDNITKIIAAKVKQMQSAGNTVGTIAYYVRQALLDEYYKKSGIDKSKVPNAFSSGLVSYLDGFLDTIGPTGIYNTKYKEAKKLADSRMKELDDLQKSMDAMYGIDPTKPEVKKNTNNDDTLPPGPKPEVAAKQYDLLLSQYKDLNQKILDARIDATIKLQDEDDKELQAIRDKYDDMEDANTELWNKLQANRADALADEKKALAAGDKALADNYHKQALDLQEQMLKVDDQMKTIARQREDEITAKQQQQADKRVKITQNELDAMKKATDDYLAKYAEDRLTAEQRIMDFTGNSLDVQVYMLEKQTDELIKLAQKFGINTDAIMDARTRKLDEIMRGRLNDFVGMVEQTTGQISNLVGYIYQAIANNDNVELNRYKKQQDERKESLSRRLEHGFITQAQYDKKLAELEKQSADRESAIKNEAARREKAAAIIQAIINTALGVTRAYATMVDPISGSIMAGLIAATGAAQVIAISSQPVEQYRKGGYLLSDDLPSHEKGGLAVVDQYGNKLAEVEGGEGIIPRKHAKKYKGLVDRMIRGENLAIYNGGTMPSRLNTTAMNQAAITAGRMGDMQSGTVLAQNNMAIERLTATLDKMMNGQQNNKAKVELVYTDFERDTNRFDRVKTLTTLAYSKK